MILVAPLLAAFLINLETTLVNVAQPALLAALFLPAQPASPTADEIKTAEGTHERDTQAQPAAAAH